MAASSASASHASASSASAPFSPPLSAAAAASMSVGLSVFAAPSPLPSAAASSSTAPPPPPPPPPSTSVDGRLLESAVVSYLRKRGYAWTEEQLKALRGAGSGGGGDGGAELSEQAMDVSLDVHACLANSLFTSHPRLSSPEQFEWTYGRVRSFVIGSLDVYGVELRLALWPLFLHSFLALMLRGYPGDAILFFSAHRKDHEALHGPELTMLSHIHSEQHIRQHDYTRLALSRRIELTMSAFTCELLTAFCEHEGLATAAYILTEHTQIKVLSRRPWKAEQSAMQQQPNSSVTAANGTDKQTAAINSLDVRWGALADIVALQTQAREQLKETLRTQQRREQQQQQQQQAAQDDANSDSGGREMDVDDSRGGDAAVSQRATGGEIGRGGSGSSEPAANQWAESDKNAVKSTVGGDEANDEDGGGKGKGGRHSRRSGKKERKERGGRKSPAADDNVARLANEQIPLFKHTLQQQTVELPDMPAEQRQAYINDLTQRQTTTRSSSRPAQPSSRAGLCDTTTRLDDSLAMSAWAVCLQALGYRAQRCHPCAATHSPTPTPRQHPSAARPIHDPLAAVYLRPLTSHLAVWRCLSCCGVPCAVLPVCARRCCRLTVAWLCAAPRTRRSNCGICPPASLTRTMRPTTVHTPQQRAKPQQPCSVHSSQPPPQPTTRPLTLSLGPPPARRTLVCWVTAAQCSV